MYVSLCVRLRMMGEWYLELCLLLVWYTVEIYASYTYHIVQPRDLVRSQDHA